MPTHNTIFIPNFCRSVHDQGRDPVLCEKTIMFSNSITIYRCNSETNGTWPDSTDRGGGHSIRGQYTILENLSS